MEENKSSEWIAEEGFAQCGYSAGRALAAMLDGFIQGLADGRAELTGDIDGIKLAPDDEPELKTDIKDCRACWCDGCGKLEDCTMHREGEKPDGLHPLPCIGCVNGLRFRPKEKEPCADYIEGEGYNNG